MSIKISNMLNKISELTYKISNMLYKISDMLYKISHIEYKISYLLKCQISDEICRLLFYFNKLSLGKTFICKVERLNVKKRRFR